MVGVKKSKSIKQRSKARAQITSQQEDEYVRLGVICLTILAIVFLLMALMRY